MKTHDKSLQYWWLNAHPIEDGWILTKRPAGERVSYDLRDLESRHKRKYQWCFLAAKKGDIVIGYATKPRFRIEALLKVAAEQDGHDIYFEKTEVLKVPVTLSELRERPEVSHMRYFKSRRGFRIPQGSLYQLSLLEYAAVMDLIREKNP